MPDFTVLGTVVSLPASSASPNWSTAILQAFQLIEAALSAVGGTFDISPTVFDISAYDTATDQTITNLAFSTNAVRSAVITYYVYRTATGSLHATESGQILIDYDPLRSSNQKWALQQECVGNANISFSITDAGQLQFTTTTLGASHAGYIGFFARTLEQE